METEKVLNALSWGIERRNQKFSVENFVSRGRDRKLLTEKFLSCDRKCNHGSPHLTLNFRKILNSAGEPFPETVEEKRKFLERLDSDEDLKSRIESVSIN